MYLAKGFDGLENAVVPPARSGAPTTPTPPCRLLAATPKPPAKSTTSPKSAKRLDKVSAVPPVAGGVVRKAKIGNLTGADAFRITLMGLLAETARKRVTYSSGIAA